MHCFLKRLAGLSAAVIVAGIALPADGQVLLVANSKNLTVSKYDATTGATINAAFISGQGMNGPAGLLEDSSNHLFVSNFGLNTVGEYNATTGATINAAFLSFSFAPGGLALDGNSDLFVSLSNGVVGEYDAITGAPVNPAFIIGLTSPGELLFVPEPSSLLLVAAAAGTAAGLYRWRTKRV